jgi:hypothetical protein
MATIAKMNRSDQRHLEIKYDILTLSCYVAKNSKTTIAKTKREFISSFLIPDQNPSNQRNS